MGPERRDAVLPAGVDGPDRPESVTLSSARAWWFLVALSFRRQARARQMVWIALVLLGFSVVWVVVLNARGRFGMEHWRHPRPFGWTFRETADKLQVITGMLRPPPAAPAAEAAVLGSARVIIAPTVENAHGEVAPMGGFTVFSQGIIFS